MTYRIPARPDWIDINGTLIRVDSQTEARFIRWLEANGFSGRWRRTEKGINVGLHNYTPDVELAVQFQGKTHRAIVEVKPNKATFTPYIARRMRGIARHYYSELLLLYVDDESAWYRIDKKSGALTLFDQPEPGEMLIHELYKPLTKKAQSVYAHRYVQRLRPIAMLLLGLTNMLETFIVVSLKPTKARSRKSYYKKRGTKRGRNWII